ncbi:hypothetical protein EDB85DRAFT_2179795 [Lactarius pseudohatsudake]|nr:hypothetical protein EDB85DRAFT_2179795 [Lactarius pseudohatsudake]
MQHRKMEREVVTLMVPDSDSRSGCHPTAIGRVMACCDWIWDIVDSNYAEHVDAPLPLMLPFIFNSADIYEEEEEEEDEEEEEEVAAVAAVAAALCIITSCVAFASILEARDARNEQRRRRVAPKSSCWHTTAKAPGKPGRLRTPGDDDSGEEDDSMSITEASTSDDGFSLRDGDDDDEPPPGEKRDAPVTTKKATQPFEMSESGSDVEIKNDPLPLLKSAPAPAVKSENEDLGDDLIRAALAKGKGKAACKEDQGDCTGHGDKVFLEDEKNLAGAKLVSKTTTVRKPSGSTKLPPKKAHGKAMETSDDEF